MDGGGPVNLFQGASMDIRASSKAIFSLPNDFEAELPEAMAIEPMKKPTSRFVASTRENLAWSIAKGLFDLATLGIFTGSGCKGESPAKDYEEPQFKFGQEDAERICRISGAISEAELDRRYFDCAEGLWQYYRSREGWYSYYAASQTIFYSLKENSANSFIRERAEDRFALHLAAARHRNVYLPPNVLNIDYQFNHLNRAEK